MSGRYVNRFSGRGEVYAKYRPGYPQEITAILRSEIGFDQSKLVADIGSGTGLLSKLFLQNGNKVFAIEPNSEMRSFAEKDLAIYGEKFVSIGSQAENTSLENHSVDLVTAGQALHWFDPRAARVEFARILNEESGFLLIVYNERKKGEEAEQGFMADYENLTNKYRTKAESPDVDDASLAKFFGHSSYKIFAVPNTQDLDLDGLVGRAASSSYLPYEGQEGFENMKEDLISFFNANQKDGKITLFYTTTMCLGKIIL